MPSLFRYLRVRLPKWAVSWIILANDILFGYLAYYIVLQPLFNTTLYTHSQILTYFIIIQLIWSFLFWFGDLYKGEFTTSRLSEIQSFIQITFTIIVLTVFIVAVGGINIPVDPPEIFRYWIVFSITCLIGRLIIRSYQKYLLLKGIGREKTIVFGLNKRGRNAAFLLDQHHQQGYDVLGFVRAHDDPEDPIEPNFPILGTESQLHEIIAENQVSDVVIALNNPDHDRIMAAVARINGTPVTIKILPDMYEVISGLARTQQISGLPLMEVNPELRTWYVKSVKRIIDLCITVPIFLLILPLWGIIAACIKINSEGPVLYRQIRVGREMKPFTIYKFRSMTHDAEKQTGPVWAYENDSRITGFGRWLRRFRFDEIPQLLNVIKGEMSLVGPRPERPYFVDRLIGEYPFYRRRLNVRPGITGWAQIKHPYDRDIEDVRQKLKYDFYYIENINFNLDFKIILSTLWVMISGQGR